MNTLTAQVAQPQQSEQLPVSPRELALSQHNDTITCTICDAVYAPAPLQKPFLRYAENALEAVFMTTCHFCFRCRRPACPQCWDDVHGICGACVRDVHVPFRSASVSLPGTLYPPVSQSVLTKKSDAAQSLLILLYPGRFYADGRSAPVTDPVVAVRSAAAIPAHTSVQEEHSRKALVEGKQAGTFTTGDLDDDKEPGEDDKQEDAVIKKPARKVGRLEVIVTWVLFSMLLLIVTILVLAEFLPRVNELVLRFLHIDIRAEIAYVVRIVQQMFKH